MNKTDHPSGQNDPDAKSQSALAFLCRPVVLIPTVIITLLIATPIVYRSTRFSGIPPIEEIVDREAESFHIAEAENSFTFYRSASLMLPPIPLNSGVDSSIGLETLKFQRGWESVPEDVRVYLTKSNRALAQWRLGTELDDGVYIDVSTANWMTELSVVRDLQIFSQLAILHAVRCLDEGKPNEAWQWLKAILRSSRHSGKHGFLVERLTGLTLHETAAQAIAVWATHESASLKDVETALVEVRDIFKLTSPASEIIKVEYVTSVNTILAGREVLDKLVKYQAPNQLVGGYMFVNGEPQLSLAVMRHAVANFLSQCDLPPWERGTAEPRLGLYRPMGVETPPLMDPDRLADGVRNSVIARDLMPNFSACILVVDEEQTRQNALEVCLLMEIYRRKKGEYPTSMSLLVPELLPEIPRDWSTSSGTDRMLEVQIAFELTPDEYPELNEIPPLGLSREGRVIYGRGENTDDDGGNLDAGVDDVGIWIPVTPARANEESQK